jgi:hypothetical protein
MCDRANTGAIVSPGQVRSPMALTQERIDQTSKRPPELRLVTGRSTNSYITSPYRFNDSSEASPEFTIAFANQQQ